MVKERITETTDAQGKVVERTIERETGPTPVTVNTAPASGGGFSAIIGVLLLFALAVGGYFLFANSDSETRKDDAVAKAADNVDAAAEKAAEKIAN